MATSCEKCGTYYEVSWKSEGDDAPMFCPFCGHEHEKPKDEKYTHCDYPSL